MIVSTNWLADYIPLPKSQEALTDRLTITGLNLEGVEQVDADTAIDLEVTSNRPDCLGHIGVAREIAVIFGGELCKLDPQPKATGPAAKSLVSVDLRASRLSARYTARLIRGVKIAPSPDWLANRLKSIGIATINNVVDITNYVMFEIGQPLHAFDFAKIKGGKIIVREAHPGEEFTAIDHKTYTLTPGTCVIADAERAVALGGVMGGADTEVSDSTTDVLIEAADFDVLAIRGAARRFNLHSPSSYRFERGVDPEGIDWASRRACELILQLAGGTLCEGVVEAGTAKPQAAAISLRFSQVPRLLGVEVAPAECRRILTALGCRETKATADMVETVPPTWRADLTREIDLIEEIARIHGYDQIPEDARVPMAPSSRSREDVVLEKVRHAMTAFGFDEAYTLSAVEPELVTAFRPWGDAAPLATRTPVLRRASALRQSIVPSLLGCRRTNETLSNATIELFEIAKVYLPRSGDLPLEKRLLALTSGGGFVEVKGVVEAVLRQLAPELAVQVKPAKHPLLDPVRSCTLEVHGQSFGVLGELSKTGRQQFELRGAASIAELDLGPVVAAARLVPTAGVLCPYPPVSRDLNVVFDEAVRWADVEGIARGVAGNVLDGIEFQSDDFRDAKYLGEGKKSVLFSITLRSPDGTLTSEAADAVRDRIVAELAAKLNGKLRA